MEDLLYIRGKRLYVHVTGPISAPALLYLHGGPGAGSYDLEVLQEKLLSQHVRLITLDQRGVLRSDPLEANEPFGLHDLLEDCEAVRCKLGLSRWSVLGHSFGGYLAVRYALAYPEAVQCLIFENPTFDLGLSARSLLEAAAVTFSAEGDEANADRCKATVAQERPAEEIWGAFMEMGNTLGAQRNSLYVHGPEKDFFEHLMEQSPFPADYWNRGSCHQRKLFEEGQIFQSVLADLPTLPQPALLLKGKYDAVTSAEQIARFKQAGPKTRLLICEESSHFVHFEEPQLYANAVSQFLLQQVVE